MTTEQKLPIRKYVSWVVYWLLTSGDRTRYKIAQLEGCKVVKGPTGWDGSNTYAIRNQPPQKRSFLNWAEFKALHSEARK